MLALAGSTAIRHVESHHTTSAALVAKNATIAKIRIMPVIVSFMASTIRHKQLTLKRSLGTIPFQDVAVGGPTPCALNLHNARGSLARSNDGELASLGAPKCLTGNSNPNLLFLGCESVTNHSRAH